MARKLIKKYTCAVGRRKSASARIRLLKGKGENMVNGVAFAKYFPDNIKKARFDKLFKSLALEGKYFVTIRVVGGGKEGQFEASLQGVAKALASLDREKFRPTLKRAGLLTRDARIRERRKIGTGGKARRKKQSPKR
jgi:small subunit ribosomal protein S9